MIQRCNNSNNKDYRYYGGKSIKICKEWLKFPNFEKWAFKNGYQENLTIERIDVNKNYCPENCCWIPKSEQSKNKTNNIKITAFGETKNLADWVNDNRCSVNYQTIQQRLKSGLSPEEAISKHTQI